MMLWDMIVREYDGHIVLAVIREGHVHEQVALLDRSPTRGYHVSDRIVRHDVCQSVRAQQKDVVISETKLLDDDAGTVETCANRVCQKVLSVLDGLPDGSGMRRRCETLSQRLIARQLNEFAIPEEITTRVPHMRDE